MKSRISRGRYERVPRWVLFFLSVFRALTNQCHFFCVDLIAVATVFQIGASLALNGSVRVTSARVRGSIRDGSYMIVALEAASSTADPWVRLSIAIQKAEESCDSSR